MVIPDDELKEEKPVVKKEDAKMIEIKVTNQNMQEVKFRIKPTIKLAKVLQNYMERIEATGNLKMRFEGIVVKPDDTPESLSMEDGDTLEAFENQIGGGEE